jgi:regulator of protease activity HflC (stomatin/prohibitin superfamily)
MNRLPILGIFILMLLVISGYVSSSPAEEPQVVRLESAGRYVDPHLNYYEQHLIAMGIERRRR